MSLAIIANSYKAAASAFVDNCHETESVYKEKKPQRDSFDLAREIALPPLREDSELSIKLREEAMDKFQLLTKLRERKLARIGIDLLKLESTYRRLYGAMGVNSEGLLAKEQFLKDRKVRYMKASEFHLKKELKGLLPGCAIDDSESYDATEFIDKFHAQRDLTYILPKFLKSGSPYWVFHPSIGYVIGVFKDTEPPPPPPQAVNRNINDPIRMPLIDLTSIMPPVLLLKQNQKRYL